jgi:hypothetical protein
MYSCIPLTPKGIEIRVITGRPGCSGNHPRSSQVVFEIVEDIPTLVTVSHAIPGEVDIFIGDVPAGIRLVQHLPSRTVPVEFADGLLHPVIVAVVRVVHARSRLCLSFSVVGVIAHPVPSHISAGVRIKGGSASAS